MLVFGIQQITVNGRKLLDEELGILVVPGVHDAAERVEAVEQEVRLNLRLEAVVTVLGLMALALFLFVIPLCLYHVVRHPQNDHSRSRVVQDDVQAQKKDSDDRIIIMRRMTSTTTKAMTTGIEFCSVSGPL